MTCAIGISGRWFAPRIRRMGRAGFAMRGGNFTVSFA